MKPSLLILCPILLTLSAPLAIAQNGSTNGGSSEVLFHSLTAKTDAWLAANLKNGQLSNKLHLNDAKITAAYLVSAYTNAEADTPDVKFIATADLPGACVQGDAGACALGADPSRICVNHAAPNFIRCNNDLFTHAEGDLQFTIAFHEYLGVANIEPSGGSDSARYSTYPISKYLMSFAQPTSVVRYDLTMDDKPTVPEGTSIDDEALFKNIRAFYDGRRWEGESHGKINSEVLKDGSTLFEVSGDMARFFFYNIPDATELTQYIPPTNIAGYLNYYLRQGSGILCGMSSYDLKNTPFPEFKCRFQVHRDGTITPFGDRTTATSNATPPNYDGKWQTGYEDFLWRDLTESSDDSAAYSDNQVRRNLGGQESFEFAMAGEEIRKLYFSLQVPETIFMMQNPHFKSREKIGPAFWCYDWGKRYALRCTFAFGFAGQPFQNHIAGE